MSRISCGSATYPTCRDLESVGPPRALVCPGQFHDTFIDDAFGRFEEARVFGPPGVPNPWGDRTFDGILGAEPDPLWSDTLDQALFDGGPRFREAVFLHRPSRTLIVADILGNFDHTWPFISRLYARAGGFYKRTRMSRSLRVLVMDRTAARVPIARIAAWDFDRIIIGHGPIVESGGKALFQEAFRWLKG